MFPCYSKIKIQDSFSVFINCPFKLRPLTDNNLIIYLILTLTSSKIYLSILWYSFPERGLKVVAATLPNLRT